MAIGAAYVLEALAHDSRVPRQMAAGLLGVDILGAYTPTIGPGGYSPGHGVADASDFLVKQNGTPNMSVLVEGGYAFVRGAFSSLNQGVYGVPGDATDVNLAISASDPTNARKDIVLLQVRDSTWGSGGGPNDTRLVVVTGTPSGSPADPSLSAFGTCLPLGRVNVPANATSITNANIDDIRPKLAIPGSPIVCTSTTRPSGTFLRTGTQIYETDTGFRYHYNLGAATWCRDTPRVIMDGTEYNGNAGGTLTVQAGSTVGTTNGSGVLAVTYPVAFIAATHPLSMNGDQSSGAFIHNLVSPPTPTGFQVQIVGTGGAPLASSITRVDWIAIGYTA